VTALFERWQTNNLSNLKNISIGTSPKQLIDVLSEEILQIFAEAQLIDKYDVYQHLMSYWVDTMQDDVYMIAQDGWKTINEREYKDLIPPQLLINRYFTAEQQNIELLEVAREAIARQMEELDEEHGGEGGLLEEAKNDKGKITRASIKTRLMDILAEPETEDEQTMLNTYLRLLDQETEASRKVKNAQKALDANVTKKYKQLSEEEIKTLVVDDKWLTTLANDVQTELNRISQALTGRIKELAERYVTPLPTITEEIEILSSKVEAHLKMMGVLW
jgi:type I restriction enzyme M protein